MKNEDLKWKDTKELPIEEEQMKKVLLLTEGKLSGSTTLHVVTDYWQVFFDKRDLNLNIFNNKKKLSNNMFSYGKLMENKVPFEKIKGWMYADDLIELYRNEKKQ